MPTRRSSLAHQRRGGPAADDDRLLAVLDDDPEDSAEPSPSPSGVTITDAPPDALQGIQSALGRRADAVRRGDEQAFLAGLAKGDAGLRDQQRTYFANLRQLPLATFDYSVDPAGLVRDGEDYWVVVDLALQLDGFDDEPVVTRDRFRFTPGDQPGRFRLASVSDLQWEVENQVQPQPWDDGEVVVTRGVGVLGIFDSGSVRASDRAAALGGAGHRRRGGRRPLVLVAVRRRLRPVQHGVPVDAARDCPAATRRASTASRSRSSPRQGGDGGGALVSTRFVLHPRMLDEAGRARDRLVRHELTHVAIGADDDRAPVWLSEGLAEYVSVQSLPPEKRTISEAAIEAARAGVTEMPPDDSFNDAGTPGRASANYGIAWFACEYLAASYGEVTLWQLLSVLNEPDVDVDSILLSQVGMNVRTLARKAGKLILTTYDAPEPEPTPTELPTEVPTDLPTTTPPTDLPTEPTPSVPPSPRGR